jgi:transposase-like protein
MRLLVQNLLQRFLEAEMTEHLQAQPYERTTERKGYRNGTKSRQLKTRVGTLQLLVPQDRDGTFKSELFARYQRNEKALVLSLMEMDLEGVSTRKVREVTERLCGTSFSKSMVSSLTKELDEELEAWRNRPLSGRYPYLIVDARYEFVRQGRQVVSQGVLIVTGVRQDGKREILAVQVADTESEATYHELFRKLKERGLQGVKLVTSDDHQGLRAAITRHFQGASWQRCQVHFVRNLLGRVARSKRKTLAADLKRIFTAPTYEWAKEAAADVAENWRSTHPALAEQLEENLEHCLTCFAFPTPHRSRIRTTNGLERLNQEIARRTRVVRIFPNPAACLRLVTALCVEQSEEWLSGKRYLDMSWLDELSDAPETQPEKEATLIPS